MTSDLYFCLTQHDPLSNFFKINPLPDDKILDWSKLKQSADDILTCSPK